MYYAECRQEAVKYDKEVKPRVQESCLGKGNTLSTCSTTKE